MRTLNELYVLLLEEYSKGGFFGLCLKINSLHRQGIILTEEKNILLKSMKKNKPKKVNVDHYWWNTYKERIDFLKQMIEITKKE